MAKGPEGRRRIQPPILPHQQASVETGCDLSRSQLFQRGATQFHRPRIDLHQAAGKVFQPRVFANRHGARAVNRNARSDFHRRPGIARREKQLDSIATLGLQCRFKDGRQHPRGHA